jgi:spermidine/putrescine transport system permease protein
MLSTLLTTVTARLFDPIDERIARMSDRQIMAAQLAPLVGLLFVFAVLPVLFVLLWSFWGFEGGDFVITFAPENYEAAFGRIGTIVESARIGLIAIVLTICAGYPAAYFIYRFVSERNRLPILLILVIPFIVNRLLRIFSLVDILSSNGPFNTLLFFIEPIEFLVHTEISLYIGLLNDTLPIAIILIYLSLERIDEDLLQASYDLGGSGLYTFRKVTLPLSAPGVVAASILIFVIAIGASSIGEIMGGVNVYMVGVMMLSIFDAQLIPLAGAVSVILLSVVGILLYLGHRYANIMALFEEIES